MGVVHGTTRPVLHRKRCARGTLTFFYHRSKYYSLLKNMCAPTKPSSMTFAELIQQLTEHLSPKSSEIAGRYRFHKRDQTAGESFIMYMPMAELRRFAIHSLSKICVWVKAGTHSEEISRSIKVGLGKSYPDSCRHGNDLLRSAGTTGKT